MAIPFLVWMNNNVPNWNVHNDRLINLRLQNLGRLNIRFSHRGGGVHRMVKVHSIRPTMCYFFNARQMEWNNVYEYFYSRYAMQLVDRNLLVSFVGREEMGLFPIESLVVDTEEED